MLAAERQRFVEDYLRIRRAEGRGSNDPAYYLALPYRDLSGRLSGQWEMRGRTYRYFEERVLPPLEHGRPLDILDLGAGCGWMSYRLASRGHRPVAVDVLSDGADGLGAARHYFGRIQPFSRIEAVFDRLPFAGERFDLAMFNASIHYSSNYAETLRESLRCLRPGGRLMILDSPVYRVRTHGEMMRRERHQQFLDRYGTASDHLGSIEYLDLPAIAELARELDIEWRVHKPWYGLAWHLRPLKAWWKRSRPPSRFWILEGIRK